MKTLFCQKRQQSGTAMDQAPYPGALGEQIRTTICEESWQDWLRHQTMLINEYRLNPLDPESDLFLEQQMSAFLFGSEPPLPPGYQPQEDPPNKRDET